MRTRAKESLRLADSISFFLAEQRSNELIDVSLSDIDKILEAARVLLKIAEKQKICHRE